MILLLIKLIIIIIYEVLWFIFESYVLSKASFCMQGLIADFVFVIILSQRLDSLLKNNHLY